MTEQAIFSPRFRNNAQLTEDLKAGLRNENKERKVTIETIPFERLIENLGELSSELKRADQRYTEDSDRLGPVNVIKKLKLAQKYKKTQADLISRYLGVDIPYSAFASNVDYSDTLFYEPKDPKLAFVKSHFGKMYNTGMTIEAMFSAASLKSILAVSGLNVPTAVCALLLTGTFNAMGYAASTTIENPIKRGDKKSRRMLEAMFIAPPLITAGMAAMGGLLRPDPQVTDIYASEIATERILPGLLEGTDLREGLNSQIESAQQDRDALLADLNQQIKLTEQSIEDQTIRAREGVTTGERLSAEGRLEGYSGNEGLYDKLERLNKERENLTDTLEYQELDGVLQNLKDQKFNLRESARTETVRFIKDNLHLIVEEEAERKLIERALDDINQMPTGKRIQIGLGVNMESMVLNGSISAGIEFILFVFGVYMRYVSMAGARAVSGDFQILIKRYKDLLVTLLKDPETVGDATRNKAAESVQIAGEMSTALADKRIYNGLMWSIKRQDGYAGQALGTLLAEAEHEFDLISVREKQVRKIQSDIVKLRKPNELVTSPSDRFNTRLDSEFKFKQPFEIKAWLYNEASIFEAEFNTRFKGITGVLDAHLQSDGDLVQTVERYRRSVTNTLASYRRFLERLPGQKREFYLATADQIRHDLHTIGVEFDRYLREFEQSIGKSELPEPFYGVTLEHSEMRDSILEKEKSIKDELDAITKHQFSDLELAEWQFMQQQQKIAELTDLNSNAIQTLELESGQLQKQQEDARKIEFITQKLAILDTQIGPKLQQLVSDFGQRIDIFKLNTYNYKITEKIIKSLKSISAEMKTAQLDLMVVYANESGYQLPDRFLSMLEVMNYIDGIDSNSSILILNDGNMEQALKQLSGGLTSNNFNADQFKAWTYNALLKQTK